MTIDYSIKAIPTRYRGHLYRSRLEAKWAAFFDLLGWRHEYEPMDFGTWSPDFAIMGAGGPIYVEVKPISDFALDVGAKMATVPGEHLLVGLSPMSVQNSASHIGAPFAWFAPEAGYSGHEDKPVMGGIAHLCEIDTPNRPSIGVISNEGSYRDRISGLHDGDHYLRSGLTPGGVEMLWGKACELVQWHKRGAA